MGHLAVKGCSRIAFHPAFWSAACGRSWHWRIGSAHFAAETKEDDSQKVTKSHKKPIDALSQKSSLN
jgi:hypothetical protein